MKNKNYLFGFLVILSHLLPPLHCGIGKFSSSIGLPGDSSVVVNHAKQQDVATINSFLIGPESYGTGECPPDCGCPQTPRDCPTWYSLNAVKASAQTQEPAVLTYLDKLLKGAHSKAKAACRGGKSSSPKGGGLCLYAKKDCTDTVTHKNGVSYPMANNQLPPSPRLLEEMINHFQADGTTSINDFGAGVGQYKAAITSALPNIEYNAYDRAGNGEEYTQGMMSFADLSLPLNLPVADWVISIEVGAHIQSKYEGVFIRNLHRHNRKGIILSWATLGHPGRSLINCHSNMYLLRIFESLGYKYNFELSTKMRAEENNYPWFPTSVLVFRKQ